MGRRRSKTVDQKSERGRLSLTLGSKYSIVVLSTSLASYDKCRLTKKIAWSSCSTQVWSSSKRITELDQEVAAAFKASHRVRR